MATIGETRLAARIKSVMEHVDDIDWLTSTSYIKESIVKINELAVDAKLFLPTSAKRTLVVNQLVKTSAYFVANWKGADGDRTAYLMDEEIVDMLKKALAYLDIPSEELEKIMPSEARAQEPAGDVKTEVDPKYLEEAGGKAADAPAEKVEVPKSEVDRTMDAMAPDSADKRRRMEEEEEEDQEKSFWSKPGGVVAAVGGGVGVLALVAGLLYAVSRKKKRKSVPAVAANRGIPY